MEWEKIVEAIKEVIKLIRKEYVIDNIIIRDDVLQILEKYCTVLYYPLDNEKNCGFHIKRIVNDKLEDFVYINTAKPLEEQVFTAAHELGHIWQVAEKVRDIIGYKEALNTKIEEDITNRFAAELLMPDDIFQKIFVEHMRDKGITGGRVKLEDLVQVIVMLMNDFLVPYVSVRKRMHETEIINDKVRDYLKENQKYILEWIKIYSKEQNSRLNKETMVKTIPGIRTSIEKAEREGRMDKYTLSKIKKDFDIQDVCIEEETLKIHLGESEDGKKGSIG